jgi:phosphonate transport system permease protein
MNAPPLLRRGPGIVRVSAVVVVVLLVAAWADLAFNRGASPAALFTERNWDHTRNFLAALVGLESPLARVPEANPFLDLGHWWRLVKLAYQTLAMSVLAIGIATIGMLLTVMAGARPRGGFVGRGRYYRLAAFGLVRGTWIATRAVPELIWALLLVLVLPPGVLAGALALAIHNFGIVGKLCSEVVEDLDFRPVRALRTAGASPMQALAYGVLPEALPRFLTFALYRGEVIIRTTIVVGFVAAGGLGQEFRLSMSFFHYTDVTMILVIYFALVLMVDAIAAQCRRLAR